MEPASLAIWNRNKVVVAIAAIIWLTNGAILIQGKVFKPRSQQGTLTET
jgi:hypothetical protein